MAAQEALQSAWLESAQGKLCGREQAKAWALREVWREEHEGSYGMLTFIASRVQKTAGGSASGGHPSKGSLVEFFAKVDADADWFPGKHSGTPRGPKRLLRGVRRNAVAAAAKRLKREGEEPTYASVVAACPGATRNPKTGEPVDKKLVYQVFQEACFDEDATDPWRHLPRLSRIALEKGAWQRRLAFAEHMHALKHKAQWYYDHLVWCDLCSSVLPRSRKKASEMAVARKGRKAWMSKGSQQHSQNLRGPQSALKLCSSDTVRVWWVPILACGKFHSKPLPDDFRGRRLMGLRRW